MFGSMAPAKGAGHSDVMVPGAGVALAGGEGANEGDVMLAGTRLTCMRSPMA